MFVHPHILEWFMDLQTVVCWKASIEASPSQRLQSLTMLVISISIMVSSLILTCFILIEEKHEITPLYFENDCLFIYVELNLPTCTLKVGDLPSPHNLCIQSLPHLYSE